MTEVNIFEIGSSGGGKWFYHKEVGDEIQGTYIDVREARDSFGNEQIVYVLKDKEGQVWNVGVRNTNAPLNDRMRNARLGQIVGFRFEEYRESKKSPTGKAKVIKVYFDPKIVDQQWLDERARIEAAFGSGTTASTPTAETGAAPANVAPLSASVPSDKAAGAPADDGGTLQAIRNIAVTKGLVEENMSHEEQDKKIVEYIGLPLNEATYPVAITKLVDYKK